jgi:1,4-alpha-glucan branching enzyme
VKVIFTLLDPVATEVALAGEFNSWSPDSLPLKRQGEGHWQTALTLKPGKYQYKFVVDGAWVTDPKATATQCNEFGTLNSVVEVKV